jgi:hypothetical protein
MVRIAHNVNAQPRALQAGAAFRGCAPCGGDDVDALTPPENISADIEISLDRAVSFR